MNRYLYEGVLEEIEAAERERLEMEALVAKYGGTELMKFLRDTKLQAGTAIATGGVLEAASYGYEQ